MKRKRITEKFVEENFNNKKYFILVADTPWRDDDYTHFTSAYYCNQNKTFYFLDYLPNGKFEVYGRDKFLDNSWTIINKNFQKENK